MKRLGILLLILLIIGNIIYHIQCNIENQKRAEIDKALYCIQYGNKYEQTRYIEGNCYIANRNINKLINRYYEKEIY